MLYRRLLFISIITILLLSTLFASISQAINPAPTGLGRIVNTINNVRDYAPSTVAGGPTYLVDGGVLLSNRPTAWTVVPTPPDVIVSAVAPDARRAGVLYIGAANETAIYRSLDGGRHWLRIPLSEGYTGSITALAVDGWQRLIYVGTDTAGLFRLRDVGSSVILTAHFPLAEPVLEVVTERTGTGLALARTEQQIYRAEFGGLQWSPVANLGSIPTALTLANTIPATIYVGTADRGILKSQDGLSWQSANAGLGQLPGSRLTVNDIRSDPVQPDVLYAATSYLLGHTTVHRSPIGVAMSVDGGAHWVALYNNPGVEVVDLLPVSGQTGAVYALTSQSRQPLVLGRAPLLPSAPIIAAVGAPTWTVRNLPLWPAMALGALACVVVFVSSPHSR